MTRYEHDPPGQANVTRIARGSVAALDAEPDHGLAVLLDQPEHRAHVR